MVTIIKYKQGTEAICKVKGKTQLAIGKVINSIMVYAYGA